VNSGQWSVVSGQFALYLFDGIYPLPHPPVCIHGVSAAIPCKIRRIQDLEVIIRRTKDLGAGVFWLGSCLRLRLNHDRLMGLWMARLDVTGG
jgi:hypothetical protein